MRNFHTAVYRVLGGEYGGGEDADAVTVGACVGEDVVLEAEPELFRLVKGSSLRGGVGVGEGIVIRSPGCRCVAPDRVLAPDEVPAVEVVSGVDALPGLFVGGDKRVEVPVVDSVNGNEAVTVDVDAGRDREAPRGVEEHGEMCVEQFTNQGSCGRGGERQRDLEELGVVSRRIK